MNVSTHKLNYDNQDIPTYAENTQKHVKIQEYESQEEEPVV